MLRAQHRLIPCVVLLPALSSAQAQNWTQVKPNTSPPGRSIHAMTYDANRQRVVLFGGEGSTNRLADTWEWDGANWTPTKPTTSPPARNGHAMAFDAAILRVLLFGGGDGNPSGNRSDTWSWDGNSWRELKPNTAPGARSFHAMAHDAARKRVVLFGGQDSTGAPLNDTWEWDGSAWVPLSVGVRPPARVQHAMAYDAAQERVVLFGGQDSQGTLLADTWEWDGKTWTQIKPTRSPPPRRLHAMAYDAAQRIVLFGGFDNKSAGLGDTWQWERGAWTEVTAATSPGGRYGTAMIYHAARQRVVLFGGTAGSARPSDTWEYYAGLLATSSVFGTGCSSTAIPPSISTTPPKLSQNVTLEIKGFLPKPQFGQLIFGTSNTRWGIIPLPLSLSVLGMPNCMLLVSIDSPTAIVTDSLGGFRTTLTVPSSTTLLGATVYAQAVAPDTSANITGAATTNAFKAVVGY